MVNKCRICGKIIWNVPKYCFRCRYVLTYQEKTTKKEQIKHDGIITIRKINQGG